MTSISITGDGRAAIEKTIEVQPSLLVSTKDNSWKIVFELQRCIEWIRNNNYKKVCLQIPDEYLEFSRRIVETLEEATGQRCYVIADSTYGSCCVDEKTASHVPDADSLIHFGPSCLSAYSGRYPVLYVFTKPTVDVEKIEGLFKTNFTTEDNVIILFDVVYEHTSELLFRRLKDTYPNTLLSTLVLPGEADKTVSDSEVIKHGRRIPLKQNKALAEYKVFFIGSRTLPNLLLALPNNTFKVYDPLLSPEELTVQTSSINKFIRKRNFYVEKIKDINSVGILVGTLVVQNYLSVIERLKTILKKVGKKFYTVSVGEINPCKLGNFMDIECFVFVGCPEVVNYYLSDESKGQFFQPILTPYDVELAFCDPQTSETYTGQEYIIDWSFLIEQGPPKIKAVEEDVSLITGSLRSAVLNGDDSGDPSGNNVVNWLGLDESEQSASSNPSEIHKGRSGIASSYADEPLTNK